MSSKQGWIGYETVRHPIISRADFARRMVRAFGVAVALIAVSLFGGMAGYRYLEDMPWLDAFVNAAMILGGMGPVDPLKTSAGKLFAGCYALYSGLLIIVSAGVLLGPMLHRMLHKMHADLEPKKGERDSDDEQ